MVQPTDLKNASKRCFYNTTSMHQHTSAAVVGTFELFKGLTLKEQTDVGKLLQTQQFKVGNFIVSREIPETDVFFLVSGRVRACAFTNNGKLVHFEELAPGSLFGELAAIDQGQRSGDCIALNDVVIAKMTRDDFLRTAHQHPGVFDSLLLRLVAMVRRQMERVYEFSSCTVSQRVRNELVRISASGAADCSEPNSPIKLTSPPTHVEIATRIGSHREAVTRELNKLNAMGVITWRPGFHVIHDIEALVQLASSDE